MRVQSVITANQQQASQRVGDWPRRDHSSGPPAKMAIIERQTLGQSSKPLLALHPLELYPPAHASYLELPHSNRLKTEAHQPTGQQMTALMDGGEGNQAHDARPDIRQHPQCEIV